MTEPHESIFSLYHDDGYSVRAIAEILVNDGYEISRETVRKILKGATDSDQTEALRKRFPPYKPSRSTKALTADEYAAIYDAYHNRRLSLSQIASGYDNLDYKHISQILSGEGEHANPTTALRRRYPAYAPRTGRHSKKTPPQETIAEVFRVYFEENQPIAETSRRTGVSKAQIKELIEGREAPKLTAKLRARHGSELRYAGPPTGPRWYEARGLDPGVNG